MAGLLSTFPVQSTPFVGREQELASITNALADPACRLLTLTGPGGVGKTRLAIQVAHNVAANFDRGAFFINLQPVETGVHLVSVVTDTLDISLSGQEDPRTQLLNYLSDKEMLLVLDNFENLLIEVDFVAQLLQSAPALKVIVTSRQAVNLREEWLFPITGLPYPDKVDDDATYSAVLFFVSCARRLRPDFPFDEEQDDVIRICQLVDGLPLALEMAAYWTKTLPCAEIAAEIQRDIEFLTGTQRNAAPQHQSMLAVFDQSWRRFSLEERAVFTRLSVFSGSFDLQAAREVAGASLPVLSGLVDKSILRLGAAGRYQIHELLRQYGRNQLERTPDDAVLAEERHGYHYIGFVHTLEPDLLAGRQREATVDFKTELENIRKAWEWVIKTGNIDAIERSVMAFSLFYQYQSRYVEAIRMLEDAEDALKKQPPSKRRDLVLVSVLCDLGWLRIRLGKIDQAEQNVLESMALMESQSARPYLGNGFDPRLPLGVIASIRGDYAETARLGKAVLQESQSRHEVWNEQFSYYLLTRAALLQGDVNPAKAYAQQTYQLAKRNQDHWFMAYCLNELGNVALVLGDNATARGYFQESYKLREAFNDLEGMAVALNNLGEIDLKESDLRSAQAHYQQSREIYREISDQGGLATALNGLAQVALDQGQLLEAWRFFLMALEISSEIHYLSLIIAILSGIARLMLRVGETREVPEILTLVENHPASDQETVKLVRKIAQENKLDIPPGPEKPTNIAEYVAHLLVWLPTLETVIAARVTQPIRSQPLIDPLTERELDVLRHIAGGLTNQQIAEALIISTGTAKWYTSQIYSKLGVQKRTQAVSKARELGLLD